MTRTQELIGAVFARLVTILTRLYPRAFRDEFGASVRLLAERELHRAAERGMSAMLRASAAQAWDIMKSALGQRTAAVKQARGLGWSAWRRDALYGTRLLAKHRTFSAVVIVTMALAIGANTVIFTFCNILLFKPLPVRDPDTLGWIYNIKPQRQGNRARTSIADFLSYRESARSFVALAARRPATFTMTDNGESEHVTATEVTANLFDVWGSSFTAGRGFHSGDDAATPNRVVVLSHQFWVRRFGSQSILGHAVALDGIPYVVIGVLDPAIEIGNMRSIDIWTPLPLDAAIGRDERHLAVVGRLAQGVSHTAAAAELHAIALRLQREYKTTNDGWDVRVTTTHDSLAGDNAWIALALLSLIVALILIIACANLANVMLARATERSREVALRTALGASRGALIRQLLVESVLLGAVGGGVGLALASGGLVLLKAVAHEDIFATLEIDRNVFAFATIATFTASIAFSLIPALHASRADVAELLKGVRPAGSVRGRRGRGALVVSQIALAMALTVVAVFTVRSLLNTARIDVGYDTHDLFGFAVDVPATRYDNARLPLLYDRIISGLSSLPGVNSVEVADQIPVVGGEATGPMMIEGRIATGPQDAAWGATMSVGPEFFATTRIRIVAGRAFAKSDRAGAVRTAIVSEEMARKYWGSVSGALGRRVAVGSAQPAQWATVVGVSSDTRPAEITLPPASQLYLPIAQRPSASVAFLIRSARARTLALDVRRVMRQVDAGLAVYDARTVDESFAIDRSSTVVLTGMYTVFAGIALALAAAGLYGVISYSVSQRTREIGIRMALGATAGEVRRLVLAQGARLLVVGTIIGIGGGALIATGARSLLYGVSAADPATYGFVLAIIVGVMAVATFIPARRATTVDPNEALRAD